MAADLGLRANLDFACSIFALMAVRTSVSDLVHLMQHVRRAHETKKETKEEANKQTAMNDL